MYKTFYIIVLVLVILNRTRTRCIDQNLTEVKLRIIPHNNFMLYENVVKAEKSFKCAESVTLVTHADFTYLDILPLLVSRWKGPISLAIYAPGLDFRRALQSVAYLLQCKSKLIRKYVTIHMFHDRLHPPRNNSAHELLLLDPANRKGCHAKPPFSTVRRSDSYRVRHKLSYPINVARNLASREARTHYRLLSDIELVPSKHIIRRFLRFIDAHPEFRQFADPRVFALPVFEIANDVPLPSKKSELQLLVKKQKAFYFHQKLCNECHSIPAAQKWLSQVDSPTTNYVAKVKRMGKFKRWEPFYIGTETDPAFDERVTWEGASNKMIQDYVLCLLNYDIVVLDNVFLVHKPGISKHSRQLVPDKMRMSRIIRDEIVPEMKLRYGHRRGCIVGGQFTEG